MMDMQDHAYTVVIEPAEDGGFCVYVPDLPGCVSAGDTPDEALANIREAMQGHIELMRESGEPIPTAKTTAATVHAA